jgi:arabinogalactan oligomer / maltooligosaccharide transport system permease protein
MASPETGLVSSGESPSKRRGASPRRLPRGSMSGLLIKILLLAMLNGLVLWAVPRMVSQKAWGFAIATIVATAAIDLIYLSKKSVPLKYLIPGTMFLLVFNVYAVGYTIYNSFTNYSTANNLDKTQAIDQIVRNSVLPSGSGERLTLQVLAQGDVNGPLAFLLTSPDGAQQLGSATGLVPVDPATVTKDGTRVSKVGPYVSLRLGDANRRKAEIDAFVVKGPKGDIQNDGFTAAFVKTQQFRYDVTTDTMVDTIDGTVFRQKEGAFVSEAGRRLDPGWRAVVGTANFRKIFTDPQIYGPFVRVLIWTFVYAVLSVLMSFALGLFLANVFNGRNLRGQRIYRSLMVVPYAIPSFMTALVWRGMLNQKYGIINYIFNTNIPWLDNQWMARVSILLVNLWLGFPYMFLVCTGALQSIPAELKEAAKIDGATARQSFQWVTMPLLLAVLAPLLIASFAFNFNNFNTIFLLTEGRPAIGGSTAGQTDILITYTYKLAFGSAKGAEYGFASAISIIVFLIVGSISAFSFRRTKAFEELR